MEGMVPYQAYEQMSKRLMFFSALSTLLTMMLVRSGRGRTDKERLIDERIFNERDRRLLKRRLLDGIRYEPLAEEFGLSVRHVKNIVKKSKKTLEQ